LKQLLSMALHRANQEIGKSIDGENLPIFLERVIAAFLSASLKLSAGQAVDIEPLIDAVLMGLDSVNQS
jgi:hypothetical protein